MNEDKVPPWAATLPPRPVGTHGQRDLSKETQPLTLSNIKNCRFCSCLYYLNIFWTIGFYHISRCAVVWCRNVYWSISFFNLLLSLIMFYIFHKNVTKTLCYSSRLSHYELFMTLGLFRFVSFLSEKVVQRGYSDLCCSYCTVHRSCWLDSAALNGAFGGWGGGASCFPERTLLRLSKKIKVRIDTHTLADLKDTGISCCSCAVGLFGDWDALLSIACKHWANHQHYLALTQVNSHRE